MKFITMVIKGRYFNPSRASPKDVAVREIYSGRREVFIDKKPAVAIITGYCTESNLIRGKFKKLIAVILHGQEWERYCCFLSMIFNKPEMIAQLLNSALTFSTLPESTSAPPNFPNTAVSPLSKRARANDTPTTRARGALYFSDTGRFFFLKKKEKC